MARWRERGRLGRKAGGSLLVVVLAGASPAVSFAQQSAPVAPLPAAEPIISDDEFNAAVPKVSAEDDPELARPLESVDAFEQRATTGSAGAAAAAARDAELTQPLPPLENFTFDPVTIAEAAPDTRDAEVRYEVRLNGLGAGDLADDTDITGQFEEFSALRRGKGKAANAAQISSRADEDVLLLKKLLASQGWFDAKVTARIDRAAANGNKPLGVVIDVAAGKRFAFSSIAVTAAATVPPGLIRDNLPLQPGEPVIASRMLAAEAKVALALPEHGYPFSEIGPRDVLLDPDSGGAAYTLPVTVGPRGTYGAIRSEGRPAFNAKHIAVIARFKRGELYDSRQVDDLRQALIATGLFKAVAVEPGRTGQPGPDGTEVVDLVVRQEAGPPRVIAATAGYGTGQGFRLEASWTHRNLFPPEGALIVNGYAGTQEQGAGVTFRRSNAGRRDRSLELAGELKHANYDAYSAYTGRLALRISSDSTPLWQKRITYAYGGQLIVSDEKAYDPRLRTSPRRTYEIAGLSGQLGLDTTDSLLDPSKGFRLTILAEPEGSLRGAFAPYARLRLDGSAYYNVSDGIILAGRIRVATIQGIGLDDLAPSRRLYAGGGGSVRGFGYQQLGPRDVNNDPTGARSLNEGSFEARYRFGDYGVVAFADVGQAYASSLPDFSDLRVGVGLGARVYTNFGPIRVDVATPLRRRTGESRINVYVSIGQSF